MRLTPAILVAAYDFLRATPPFVGWRLPEADDVEFRVCHFAHLGECHANDGTHVIALSGRRISHTDTLMRTMAHEMIHLRHNHVGTAAMVNTVHGAQFVRDAKLVAKAHGYDPLEL
jgi:hypothetical protein